jgi:hypothetical protein
MRNVQRRLHILERLPQPQPPPTRIERIKSLALQRLSEQDLELLRAILRGPAAEKRPRELSEMEGAALVAWGTALEAEARRIGFTSWAEAVRTAGQRP